MKTLKTLVEHARCRKGPAFATTKNGAFWLATPPIRIRSYGGDGIGQSSAAVMHELQLRHFRDGTIQAVVHYQSWHQNSYTTETFTSVDILNLNTVEDVVIALKQVEIKTDERSDCDDLSRTSAYSEKSRKCLESALVHLGMLLAAPAPDDEPDHSDPAKLNSEANHVQLVGHSTPEDGNLGS